MQQKIIKRIRKLIKKDKEKVLVFHNLDCDNFARIQKLYPKISHLNFVPEKQFISEEKKIIMTNCGTQLNQLSLSEKEKNLIKKQIIEFIKSLHKAGIAHRDFHSKNICWDGKQIWVIDWEFICESNAKSIAEHYDVCGKGLHSPLKSDNMNVFHASPYGIMNWLKPVGISIKDFE